MYDTQQCKTHMTTIKPTWVYCNYVHGYYFLFPAAYVIMMYLLADNYYVAYK